MSRRLLATRALGQAFSDRFVDLLSVLATRPADRENLPFMPLFNAAQVFHTTPVYLDFQNGMGVRYLTQFDQAYMPITNHSLFYTFQGVTADGLYHVALILPITNLSLPADESGVTDWQSFANNFPTYIGEVRSLLETSAPADFSPAPWPSWMPWYLSPGPAGGLAIRFSLCSDCPYRILEACVSGKQWSLNPFVCSISASLIGSCRSLNQGRVPSLEGSPMWD